MSVGVQVGHLKGLRVGHVRFGHLDLWVKMGSASGVGIRSIFRVFMHKYHPNHVKIGCYEYPLNQGNLTIKQPIQPLDQPYTCDEKHKSTLDLYKL